MHSQSRITRKQQRRVPAVRPVHSPLYRSLFLGIVLGAALPVAAQTVDAVRVEGRQHGRLARRCQPSRAGRADRFRQRDVARRRCGGGHRQHLCRAQARPDRHRRQRRLVRRAEHERGGFDGAVGRPGDRDLRLPGLRGSRTGRGKGRGWRDDRANRRQSRGGRGPGRADGSRHGILRRGPYASARAGAASLEVGRNLSVGGDFVIDAAPVGVMLVSSGSGAAQAARGYPGDGGRRRIRRGPPGIVRRSGPGGNQSSEDVLASARWRPVMLDVGGKLAVTGDTTLHGTDANVIRVGEARAVGDGRASDAGVMRIRVTGDSVIGGGLALQAGSADIMSTRSASDTAQATGQSVQYVAQGDLRVAQGITLQAGSAKVGRPGRDLRFNGVAKGRQQPSGERQPDQRWSGQRAGGHPLRGCPTRHAGIPRDRHRRARLRRRRIRLAVGGGDALYPPSGRTGRGRRARRRAAGNRAAGSPYGQAMPLARCAARQRPSVTPAASASARWTCATPAPN